MTTPSRIEAFRGILRLEERRGFDDRAVTKGLDAFLAGWQRELEAAGEMPGRALLLRLKGARIIGVTYAQMAVEARRAWAERAWGVVGGRGTAVPHPAPSNPPNSPSLKGRGEQVPETTGTHREVASVHGSSASPRTGSATVVAANTRGTAPRPAAPSPHLSPLPQGERAKKAVGPPVESGVTMVRGVGPGIAEKLAALEISTVRDLLYHFPRKHIVPVKISELTAGEEQAIIATVWESRIVRMGARMEATEATVVDESGNLRIVWFNQPFVARSLHTNDRVLITGNLRPSRVQTRGGQMPFEPTGYETLQPDDDLFKLGRPFPIYPATEGLTQRMLRRTIREALDVWLPRLEDSVPQRVLAKLGLPGRQDALARYHYPNDEAALAKARRRLAFDELFLSQLGVLTRKRRWQEQGSGVVLKPPPGVLETFLKSLPFALTGAQQRTLDEVLDDLSKPVPMSRLLQGEVGSGKTVVALAVMLAAATSGYQAALMAPTEILAEQHFLTVSKLLQGLSKPVQEQYVTVVYVEPHPQPIAVGLLLGSMPKRAKDEQVARIAKGGIDILIGTHAVIQGDVALKNLALAVVDEQHRFGVEQRAALRGKGAASPLVPLHLRDGEGDFAGTPREVASVHGPTGSPRTGSTTRASGKRSGTDFPHSSGQASTSVPLPASLETGSLHPSPLPQGERGKGGRMVPHLLAMSATPIPRSLALTVYGDLDLSVLDELPPGRQKVRTRWVRPDQRGSAYEFIRKQVGERRQAFVICPLINESEALQTRAALEEYETLSKQVFPELRVALLHGRMPLKEKTAAMDAFRNHQSDILVSTPVIEVGVDVPNATVMMIEGADRFGLAELHQFRGRVGRGQHASYCMLLADDPSEVAQQRLTLLEKESDGFKVAEADLALRGPGEVLGTRQSGMPDFQVATLTDQELLLLARSEATALLAGDAELRRAEHRALARELKPYLRGEAERADVS
ncbi:MAG: ATP-dependent DNA helicase RecG [Dehalococcoidia bacterium]|nr:ATP-dependent DNA helicase RecG [Dehalococcoidia bacterium]